MREVAVTYRGVAVMVPCSSAAEELRLRLTTAVKNRAVGSEGLPALSWEGFFGAKLQDENRDTKVADGLLASHRNARVMLNQSVRHDEMKSGAELIEALTSKHIVMTDVDDTIKVEMAFAKVMAGEAGATHIGDLVVEILEGKSGNNKATLQNRVEELAELAKNKCLLLFCTAAQNSLAVVIELLRKMVSGIAPPKTSLQCSPFMQRVAKALSHYITAKAQNGMEVHGEAAARIILKELKAKSEKEALMFTDFDEVWQFKYVLNEEETKTLSDQDCVEELKELEKNKCLVLLCPGAVFLVRTQSWMGALVP